MSFIFGKRQTFADVARLNVTSFNKEQPQRIRTHTMALNTYLLEMLKEKIQNASRTFGLTSVTFNVRNALQDYYRRYEPEQNLQEHEINIPPFAPLSNEQVQDLINNLSIYLTQEEFRFDLVDECYTVSWASQPVQDRTCPAGSDSKPATQNQ
jgi:hypothetical protein